MYPSAGGPHRFAYLVLLTITFLISFCCEAAIAQECSSTSFQLSQTLTDVGGLIAVDMNKDGKVDLVTTNGVLLLGAGDGTFNQRITLFSGPYGVLNVADLNRDGQPDLVLSRAWRSIPLSNLVYVAQSDGTFGFGKPVNAGADVVADFNGDGIPDLAGAIGYSAGVPGANLSEMFVAFGKGDGTFQKAVEYPYDLAQPGRVTAADLNGDGAVDLVVLSGAGFLVFLNDGKGNFRVDQVDLSPDLWTSVYVGDLNNDGIPDLVGADYEGLTGGCITALLGSGDGTSFTRGACQPVYPSSMTLGDFNRDGKLDVAFTHAAKLEIMFGVGDGTFFAPDVVFTQFRNLPLDGVIAADVDGDGLLDLVVMSGTNRVAYVLINNCSGFTPPPTIVLEPANQTVLVGTDVSFSVKATSHLPLTFQWQFDGKDIGSATNSTLLLPSVRVQQGGAYSVVVRTPFSSATSTAATLTVIPKLPAISDSTSLRAALQATPSITFHDDGAVVFDQPLIISSNTTLDATGHTVYFDGRTTSSHFVVTNGATLRLINLNLIDGRVLGAVGPTNGTGFPGLGGSIYSVGSRVELLNCTFSLNQAAGGPGGQSTVMFGGVAALPTIGGNGLGGAICLLGGELLAANCVFNSNTVIGGGGQRSLDSYTGGGGDGFGGAIYSSNALVTLVGTTFANNSVQAGPMSGGRPYFGGGRAYGGALAEISSTNVISNCVFTANAALGVLGVGGDSGSGRGGALFQDGGATRITQSLCTGNIAAGGPGVARGVALWVAADASAGGIFNQAGNLQVDSSALIGNYAYGGSGTNVPAGFGGEGGIGSGGAIYNRGALLLVNCTVAENSAVGGVPAPQAAGGSALGGALFNDGGSAGIWNVTIASNVVQIGHPTLQFFVPVAWGDSIFTTNGTVVLTNSILAVAAGHTNVLGLVTDGGHNISSDSSAQFTSPTSRNNTDPMLGKLGNYGGLTPTFPLLPRSPAVDAGDNTVCPATDQRGATRPVGATCDIGAFELTPTLTLEHASDGRIQIDYVFEPNQPHQISTSTNLLDWLLLGTGITDTNGFWQFLDQPTSANPRRFYRVQ